MYFIGNKKKLATLATNRNKIHIHIQQTTVTVMLGKGLSPLVMKKAYMFGYRSLHWKCPTPIGNPLVCLYVELYS